MRPPSAAAAPGAQLAFTIRELRTIEEFHRAENAQRDIWGIEDNTEVAPMNLLLTAQKNDGLVLGAFNEADAMIGFLFGFLGRTADGHWKHCSYMMGALPAYRRAGLGAALKRRQRECVLGQGLDLITWTFDPLEGVNASLNFGKLGVVCRTYCRNLYGDMADELNRGLPSDRFEVEWWIASPRVARRLQQGSTRPRLAELQQGGAKLINRTGLDRGLRIPQETDLDLGAPALLIEVPSDFQTIKATSMNVARAWREHTRAIFEMCFQAGYLAAEFVSEVYGTERRNFYVLERSVSGLGDAGPASNQH